MFPGIEITQYARVTSHERLRTGEARRIAHERTNSAVIDLAQYFRRREPRPEPRTLSTLEKRVA